MTELSFDKKGNNPLFAFNCLIQGLKLLTRKELRKFLILPIAVNIFFYFTAFFVSTYYIAELIEKFIPFWLEWLSWLLWPLFFISFFIAGFFTFTILANLIAAPFYGKLAARTLAVVSDDAIQIAEPPMHKVMLSELKRLAYILLRLIPLVILSIIPGLNVIAPVLWVLFGAWSLSMEYFAYPLENAGLLFNEQRALIKSVRFGSLSFGGIVVGALAVPIFNIVVPPAAVIASTLFSYNAKV